MRPSIKIHWSFLCVAAAMVLLGQVKTFALFVVFVTLHELAHVAVARRFHATVESIRLTAMGEAASLRGVHQLSAARRCAVYAAGPLVNALLALAALAFGWRRGAAVNMWIGGANLLPFFPLDGGRLAQLVIGNRLGVLRGNRLLARLGRGAGLLLMGAGLAQAVLYPCNISLLCVGAYIRKRNKALPLPLTLEFFQAMAEKPKQPHLLPVRWLAAHTETAIPRVVERLGWDTFTVVRLRGTEESLTETALMDYVLANGLSGTLGEVWENKKGCCKTARKQRAAAPEIMV